MFSYFYHERIKKATAMFGALFNDMYILRKNSKKEGVSQIKVPISFAPKRKFIERLESLENDVNKANVVAVKLPRMSFEMIDLQFDATRNLPKMNTCVVENNDGTKSKIYTKTPYMLQYELNIYAKNHDDALQLLEQIIPYFKPQYTLTIMPLDDYPNIKDDVPLSLTSISISDDFEGPQEVRRTIIYSLNFEMKIDFYGPAQDGKIIKEVNVDFFVDDSIQYSNFNMDSNCDTTITLIGNG